MQQNVHIRDEILKEENIRLHTAIKTRASLAEVGLRFHLSLSLYEFINKENVT